MALDPKLRINLERVTVLIIDGNSQGVDILRQLFSGFGVRTLLKASCGEEAKHIMADREINLVVCNDVLPDMPGYEFVRWLRRSKIEPNAFTPVILTSGHTKRSMVSEARDTGANFVIAKPISTKVLLERVVFVARESRPFLDAGEYTGPDRRFHDMGPPETGGRRREDPAPGEIPTPDVADEADPDLKAAGA
jgi:DNA-binding response OmpR family regulator